MLQNRTSTFLWPQALFRLLLWYKNKVEILQMSGISMYVHLFNVHRALIVLYGVYIIFYSDSRSYDHSVWEGGT